MTAAERQSEYLSPEDYLEGEILAKTRHEYINGQVYAMAGSTDDHNRISGNIFRELGNALRGQRCEPFINDVKIKIPPSFGDLFYYPDIFVACDPTNNAKYYRERPILIFEVLSESTRATDEREKVFAYHHLPTLKAYVLVDQEDPTITVLHRQEIGWRRETVSGRNALLKLSCIGFQIPFEVIYERTAVLTVS